MLGFPKFTCGDAVVVLTGGGAVAPLTRVACEGVVGPGTAGVVVHGAERSGATEGADHLVVGVVVEVGVAKERAAQQVCRHACVCCEVSGALSPPSRRRPQPPLPSFFLCHFKDSPLSCQHFPLSPVHPARSATAKSPLPFYLHLSQSAPPLSSPKLTHPARRRHALLPSPCRRPLPLPLPRAPRAASSGEVGVKRRVVVRGCIVTVDAAAPEEEDIVTVDAAAPEALLRLRKETS